MDPTKIRLVATGVDSDGTSVVVSDRMIEPRTAAAVPGYAWHRLWSADKIPSAPNAGIEPHAPSHFPPPGGLRFMVFTVPPGTVTVPPGLDMESAMRELEEKFPGRAAYMESHPTGLHTTATIDLIYIVDGEICLELDNEQEIRLSKGDSIIQNGTRHAWRNHTSRPCTMVVTIVGASES